MTGTAVEYIVHLETSLLVLVERGSAPAGAVCFLKDTVNKVGCDFFFLHGIIP